MRLNLQTMRARVDRLAADFAVPGVVLFQWQGTRDQCPACGYDLQEHVKAAALATLGPEQRGFLWLSTDDLSACPQCGRALTP